MGGKATTRKLDGCGDEIRTDRHYYVQDTRTVVGNCVSWRGEPPGNGYTCDLAQAGIYSGAQVMGMRETDVPWPDTVVRSCAVSHVKMESLRARRGQREQQRTSGLG